MSATARGSQASIGKQRRFSKLRTLRLWDIPRIVAILILCVVMGFPVYMTFASSVFPTGELLRSGLFPPLSRLTLENFVTALNTIPLGQQYITSLAVVTMQTLAQLVTAALAAYALVFPRWKGRGIAFALIIATLAVPGESLIIPNYELVSELGLRDTIFGVVVPFLAVGYPIFLLRQAFASFPREVWEASRLDGCGDLRSLFLVVMPACRSQVTTAVLWSALAAWNGFFWPLLITDTPVNRTVQVGLSQLVSAETSDPATIFAGTALVLIPTILLVIFSQRLLVSGMARGVLK